MIRKIYDITLKDVILLDATKSARHLMKYRFVPIWFYRKNLEELAKEIFDRFGNNDLIDRLQDDFDKIISYRNLQIMEALYKLVIIELHLKSKINVWKIIAGKDFNESDQLKEVLDEILKHTGIEINQPDDIKKLNEYIEFKIDKHKELFPKKKDNDNDEDEDEVERKPASLTKIIYSVFNFMAENYNENMRLITFIEMKEIAEERISKSQQTEDNGK